MRRHYYHYPPPTAAKILVSVATVLFIFCTGKSSSSNNSIEAFQTALLSSSSSSSSQTQRCIVHPPTRLLVQQQQQQHNTNDMEQSSSSSSLQRQEADGGEDDNNNNNNAALAAVDTDNDVAAANDEDEAEPSVASMPTEDDKDDDDDVDDDDKVVVNQQSSSLTEPSTTTVAVAITTASKAVDNGEDDKDGTELPSSKTMTTTNTLLPASRQNFAADVLRDDSTTATTKQVQVPSPTTPSPMAPSPSTMFRPPPPPSTPSAAQELLEAVLDVTVAGSVALLNGLRYTAATALTASLPEEERSELLSRMKPPKDDTKNEQVAMNDAKEDEEEKEDDRGSVQEEIALAVREQARKNEQQWQREKEKITQQLEAAAEARMQSELRVQQQRMEQERKIWQTQTLSMSEETMTTLQQKIASLETELQKATVAKQQMEVESAKAMAQAKRDVAKQQQDQIVIETKELQNVEAMLKKRREQQSMLEQVEKGLREKADQIKTEKEELRKLEQEAQAAPKVENVAANADDAVPHLSPKEYRSLSQEEKQHLKEMRDATKKATNNEDAGASEDHPILGPVIVDLGYKRIHLVSSGRLGTIPIWKRQRTYRNDRARRMASDKQATMNLGFPGIICLYEDSKGGLSILDGQHRVGMMQTLREMQNKEGSSSNTDEIFQNVLVEVYSDPSEETERSLQGKSVAEQVFVEINKAEPLKMLDIPGVASTADRNLITEAVETLRDQFPAMFSTSQRCRPPNVNIDNLRNSIFGANILLRHELTTSGKLLNWLLEQNAKLGETYERDEQRQKFLSSKAWTKASKNGFYLGLESSWQFQ